jgi:hypothetical protein
MSFNTSMTAPVASGWSGCRVGLAPTGKRRLCTAHATSGLLHREKESSIPITIPDPLIADLIVQIPNAHPCEFCF